MTLLTLENLIVDRAGTRAVNAASLRIEAGEMVGLIGPNGAGKTTLMRAALGLLPHRGVSSLQGMTASARARAVAWLPQTRMIAWPVSVETVVSLGRIPHLPSGARMSDADRQAIEDALSRMELDLYRHRPATELSGGEQARVLIARALAQEAPLLLADEPIAGLDPAAQIATMRVLAGVAAAGGGVLVSLHDLGHAARHCTRLVLMDKGRIVADGPADAVLTEAHLRDVFGVTGHFSQTPAGPVFHPMDVVP